MDEFKIQGPEGPLNGQVNLPGSKSISNRVLIINALSQHHNDISNLSDSDDTKILQSILNSDDHIKYAGHAGTSFRFSVAYFALHTDTQILTGSERMKKRPIGPLVKTLRQLGADIDYLENENYPPLRIKPWKGQKSEFAEIDAHMSSQFISALCMIAPLLEKGLKIHLKGRLVSRPYLEMTLKIMKEFGVASLETEDIITIDHQQYLPRDYIVESDWSAASYYYAIASMYSECNLELRHLNSNSLQGDAAIKEIAEEFGVQSTFSDGTLRLSNSNKTVQDLELDFLKTPDIAQTLAVMAAMHGIRLVSMGLDTLAIKETDRIQALINELAKCSIQYKKLDEFSYVTEGNIESPQEAIETYDDHRMAMAFAPLACLFPIRINNPDVVSKSYPRFWEDLKSLGFIITH